MRTMYPSGWLGLAAVLATTLPALAQEPQAEAPAGTAAVTVQLKPKAYRSWEILLPDERFADVGSGFLVPHAGGDVHEPRVILDAIRKAMIQ